VSSFYPTENLLESVTALGVAAASAILDCRADRSVSAKADGSPVTPADQIAERIILEGLARLAPNVPVVSEEQAERRAPGRH
jgi:3'(2'), 5'-bisphosphate nucleotidase